ncbi:hypothetical protein ABZU75_07220 [Streptosporangium sp. NPDC005286]|uniref:hypothetical protein n=1 Tax=Streptosporangium sp. NPDC005286 TaxID=3154463 RepID=UPI0033BE2D03
MSKSKRKSAARPNVQQIRQDAPPDDPPPKSLGEKLLSGPRFGEYGSDGLWTFTRHSISPLGNASLAYKYNHKPDSTEYRSSEGQVVYTISNGWGLTAVTDEASGEALNSLLPRILARLDGAVGTKFLR